jgi:hypothetical protein
LGDYLIGPNGDGVRSQETMDPTKTKGGKKWGPFIPVDKFKLRNRVLMDSTENEIQYYPRYNNYDKRPSKSAYLFGDVTGATGAKAMFSKLDGLANDPSPAGKDHLDHMMYMLGDGTDITAGLGASAPNNIIDGGETLTFTGPFILASAGPDGSWGVISSGSAKVYNKRSSVDDVYNFER